VSDDEPAVVRRASQADADEVFRLASVLAPSTVPVRDAFDVSWQAIVEDAQQLLVVAEHPAGATAACGDRLIGYLHGLAHRAFHAGGNIAWVEEVVVDVGFRGAGVGRSLMSAFEAWSSTPPVDARYLALATRRAAGFYRSLGYQESAGYFRKPR
jgi:GNAT superfamily N-acetyltransferase